MEIFKNKLHPSFSSDIRGYNYNILLDVPKNIEAFDRCQGTTFWTDYPNCQTGKYEIPVFIEAKIGEYGAN